MGTGRLIGRNFWGSVCSDCLVKGKALVLGGESVGAWRWVIPLLLGRDGALGHIVSAYVIWNRFDLPYESSSFSWTGQCLVTCACPRIYHEQMITLLSMEMPCTSATIQGLDFETDSRQIVVMNSPPRPTSFLATRCIG